MRSDEPRSFAEAKEIHIDDEEAVRYWTDHLGATAEELAEAIGKVGRNRTAVEIYLGAPT